MKRRIAWVIAILSGLFLLISIPLPDPLPLIDEATALLVFVKAMAYLGYDVTRWLPIFGKNRSQPKHRTPDRNHTGATVDV